jgi:hypothetical protein
MNWQNMVKSHFMSFIDDCTKYWSVYLLKTKYEVLHYFETYNASTKSTWEEQFND